jgi:hypothetical protein
MPTPSPAVPSGAEKNPKSDCCNAEVRHQNNDSMYCNKCGDECDFAKAEKKCEKCGKIRCQQLIIAGACTISVGDGEEFYYAHTVAFCHGDCLPPCKTCDGTKSLCSYHKGFSGGKCDGLNDALCAAVPCPDCLPPAGEGELPEFILKNDCEIDEDRYCIVHGDKLPTVCNTKIQCDLALARSDERRLVREAVEKQLAWLRDNRLGSDDYRKGFEVALSSIDSLADSPKVL